MNANHFTELTNTQTTKLNTTLFSEQTTNLFTPKELFRTLRTLTGTKPATTIESYYRPLNHSLPNNPDIQTALNTVNANYILTYPERSTPDTTTPKHLIKITIVSTANYTPHEIHHNTLTPTEYGTAYGYPTTAINDYTNPEILTTGSSYEYAATNTNHSITDLRYIHFTDFATRLTDDGIQLQITRGKEIVNTLQSLANKHDFLTPLTNLLETELEFAEQKLQHYR